MARTDHDTWDLASSVGATATAVAAARAMASKADHPLIDDPFAEPLVNAVGVEFFSKLVSGELKPADLGDDASMSADRMVNGMVARTKYFDEFFLDAAAAGIRQMVILASGLDARAYRLPWPQGTTVYEIDQPQVIAFKTKTLAGLGAHPRAEHHTIAIDLRNDWPAALRAAGFDPGRQTAWIAEGLLGYLPPDAQDRLLDDITALSALGSRIATQSVTNLSQVDQEQIKQRMQSLAERWRAHGFELDMTELVYFGERNDAGAYLARHGWETEGAKNSELFARYGLEIPEEPDMMFGDLVSVSATLK